MRSTNHPNRKAVLVHGQVHPHTAQHLAGRLFFFMPAIRAKEPHACLQAAADKLHQQQSRQEALDLMDIRISDMPPAETVGGGDLLELSQSGASLAVPVAALLAGTATAAQGARADAAIPATAIGTAADYRVGSAGKLIPADALWAAAGSVALGNLSGTVALTAANMAGLAHGTVTGNITLGAVANARPGQTFILDLTQDGTGGRTLALNATYWLTVGGKAIEWGTAPNARNVLVCTTLQGGKTFITLAGKGVA